MPNFEIEDIYASSFKLVSSITFGLIIGGPAF